MPGRSPDNLVTLSLEHNTTMQVQRSEGRSLTARRQERCEAVLKLFADIGDDRRPGVRCSSDQQPHPAGSVDREFHQRTLPASASPPQPNIAYRARRA